jgi:hypothetical protein
MQHPYSSSGIPGESSSVQVWADEASGLDILLGFPFVGITGRFI